MTDKTTVSEARVTAFMGRVAAACGRSEPAPDPALIWLKAELARRMEGEKRALRAELPGLGLGAAALVLTLLVSIRWLAPIAVGLGDAAVLAGLPLALAAPLVWFFGFRPLRHAR